MTSYYVTNRYPVYPTLQGLGFGVRRIANFNTTIQVSISGKETRIGRWALPEYIYELTYDVLHENDLITLRSFWLSMHGMKSTFLFSDPDDNHITSQYLGTGNGKETQFQMQRTMLTWTDTIYAPDNIDMIYFDGAPVSPLQWSLTHWAGNLPGVLSIHAAPPPGTIITADFWYMWACRFDNDEIEFDQFMSDLYDLKKISFKTIKGSNILL